MLLFIKVMVSETSSASFFHFFHLFFLPLKLSSLPLSFLSVFQYFFSPRQTFFMQNVRFLSILLPCTVISWLGPSKGVVSWWVAPLPSQRSCRYLLLRSKSSTPLKRTPSGESNSHVRFWFHKAPVFNLWDFPWFFAWTIWTPLAAAGLHCTLWFGDLTFLCMQPAHTFF